MLKKFFTVFLGSMAAIWFSILAFIGIIFIAVVLWIGNLNETEIPSKSILYLDLTGEVEERYTPPTIQDVLVGDEINKLAFDEIVKALDLAKTDSKIEGVYINLQGAEMGLAMREELRAALQDFKISGKWIVAYADNYSQGDFLTATSADELYINPSGSLAANGLSATVPFFKKALDKLGVEIQVIKVGTFKSAVEPFIMTEMSDSARMQYDVMLGTMWKNYVSNVVSDLGLSEENDSVFKQMAATPMTSFTAAELVENKLFTDIKYAYEVINLLKSKTGTDDELNLISPHDYLATYPGLQLAELAGERDHIAVVYAVGDIVDSGKDGIVGDKMAPLIASLAENDNVKGLVLRINSGGGSAFASEQIWASLEYFKSQNKPFVVSMSDVAASGGYYIACGADKIYADPSTITGSIGIFGIIPYAQDLLNDKLGIDFSVVETNPNAVFPRIDRPLTAAQHASLEKNIHNGYDLFINRVATGRRMEEEAVRKIAEGRVWAGETALQIGLVDEMGGLADALDYMYGKTGLSADRCMEYPEITLTPIEMLLEMQSGELSADDVSFASSLRSLGLSSKEISEGKKILNRMREMNTVQTKMEDIKVY